MPTAKRLPSGSYRVQVYTHTDSNGKQHRESFTAPTKAEAEMLASQFANSNDRRRAHNITVEEALTNYIESNRATLSPSTLRGYMMDKKRLAPLFNYRIRKITSKDIQNFISEMVEKGYSPKTIKNTYALLVTSLGASDVKNEFKVNLPTIPKRTLNAPENEQIVALYNEANRNMKIAIVLAAFHSLRRGEICALKYKDLKGNELYIHADIVQGPDNKWVYKETPKTQASNRIVRLTDKELELIGSGSPDDYIVSFNPKTLTGNFTDLRKRLGIEGIVFHNLRSYYASIAVAIGVPDIYTAHMGGWREGSSVLKEHYQKKIVSMDKAYSDKMNDYFKKVLGQ